jgi:predicted Zn-dependent protease
MLARVGLSVIAAVIVLSAIGGCSTNPATGKSILSLMSREEEVTLGAEAAPQFTQQFGGAVDSPELASYVRGIGEKMAKQTESDFPSLPWEFTLLNSPVVNAFALPGGKVFFSRGLAEKLTTEAQMAGVMGHEIGHVTAQHGNQRISQAQIANIGLAVGAVAVGVAGEDTALHKYGQYGIPALALGGQVVLLKYGRDQELEADRLGMRYMSKVGYDPRGQLEVMQLLASLSQGPRPPEILSTHPDPQARVEQIQGLLQGEYASTQNNPEFKPFKERYENQFLKVIRTLPAPPAPQQTGMLNGLDGQAIDLDRPETWCLTCAASKAEEAGPVAPREGVYAFVGPAAGR